MFKINTADGLTHRVDLQNEEQAKEILDLFKSPAYQAQIRGVTVLQKVEGRGVQYSLSRPQGFSQIAYEIEEIEPQGRVKGGERITAFVDDFKVQVMVHRANPSVRVSLFRIGRRRYDPTTG